MGKDWPVVVGPHDLPALRLRLHEDLGPGGAMHDVLNRVEVMAAEEGRPSPTNARWERRTVADADLWWVPSETMPVLLDAMASIPSQVVCDPEFAPALVGMAVFQTPFLGLDSGGSDRPLTVFAVLWGPVNVTDDFGGAVPAIGISSYSVHEDYGIYMPMGRSDWVLGEGVDHHILWSELQPDDAALRSASEDRRLLAALWGLASGLPNERSYLPAFARRRLERENAWEKERRTARAGVRVIQLPDAHVRAERAPGDRHVTVRYAVKGHWRHARVGAGRTERRWVYIAPHMRGPEGAPLSNPLTTVKLLAPRPIEED